MNAPASQALATQQPPKPNNVGHTVVPLIPQDFDTAWRFSQAIVAGKLAPRGMESESQVFAAVLMGAEVGLSPMQAMQNIAVVNGRPAIWGDAQLALVEASGLLEDFEETIEVGAGEDALVATCRAVRKDRRTPIIRTYSVADAKRAGLWDKAGPWKSSPKRMLQMRARAFALRDGFADVLKGVYSREELIGEPLIDVTTAGDVATAAELNQTFLSTPDQIELKKPSASNERRRVNAQKAAPPQDASAATTTAAAAAAASPTAQEMIDETQREELAKLADANAPAPTDNASGEAEPTSEGDAGEELPDIHMDQNTAYHLMTIPQLKQCVRQLLETFNEYEPDDHAGKLTYLTAVNAKALNHSLSRKGSAVSADKKKLEALLPKASA